MKAKTDNELTPTEAQAQRIAELEAQLQLAEEKDFYQQAEIAMWKSRAAPAVRKGEYMGDHGNMVRVMMNPTRKRWWWEMISTDGKPVVLGPICYSAEEAEKSALTIRNLIRA